MFNAIYTGCCNYYQEIPVGSVQAIARSGILSFTASLIITNQPHHGALNFSRPLMAASIGALASTINALTAPFFSWMFDNKEYRIYQELIKMFVDLTLTHNLINHGTMHKVNLFAPNLAPKLAKYTAFSHNVFLKIISSATAASFHLFSSAGAENFKDFVNHRFGMNIRDVTPSVYFTV